MPPLHKRIMDTYDHHYHRHKHFRQNHVYNTSSWYRAIYNLLGIFSHIDYVSLHFGNYNSKNYSEIHKRYWIMAYEGNGAEFESRIEYQLWDAVTSSWRISNRIKRAYWITLLSTKHFCISILSYVETCKICHTPDTSLLVVMINFRKYNLLCCFFTRRCKALRFQVRLR